MDLFTNLFRNTDFMDIGTSLVAVCLLLVRLLAFVHFSPIFSHKSVPAHARIAFAFFITVLLSSRVLEEPIPEEGFSLLGAVVINFAIGFIIGYVANLMFITIVAGGEMMDAAMGFSAAQTFDPGLGSQTTIIGKFMGSLCIVVFFIVGGPERLLEGLSNSIDSYSIYAPALNFNVFKIVHLVGDIITMGFMLVSPMVLTILVNDLVLGLVSRAAPQINAFQISFTIKPSIGATIWLIILPLFFSAVAKFFTSTSRLF